MSSGTGPALAHRSVASIRSGPTPSQGQQGASTPHTPPPRAISASYGSPSAIRADDDIIIVELGSRFIRAGFAGDSLPKATLQCGLEQQRRAGDFRSWQNAPQQPGHAWAAEHEIWRSDSRDSDLGLVHDKLDRLLREAFTRHLLIDSRPRRMALVIDSSIPLPLLSTVLDTAFDRFQTPMVSLLSPPTMSAVAAGVRSALAVNLGWEETVVTSVYEYREVKSTRTIRAGRSLLDDVYKKVLHPAVQGEDFEDGARRAISFEECEDILCRLMWCRASAFRSSQRDSAQLETVEEQDETDIDASHGAPRGITRVPLWSSEPPKSVDIPLEKMADVCDDTFFDPSTPASAFDDHELPVHTLVYRHLLQLPIDTRAVCMSRITFTGGCSNILGIKERIVDELTAIVERRGWAPVWGKAVDQLHRNAKLQRRSTGSSPPGPTSPPSDSEDIRSGASSRTAHSDQDQDPVEAKILRHRERLQPIQGQIRTLHSLGPWAGASLMCQLKVSATATIDRDAWLQQGAAGASRPSEVDVKTQQRQSMGAGGLIRGGGGHHANWTLGGWGVI